MRRSCTWLLLGAIWGCQSTVPVTPGDSDHLPQPLAIELRANEPGRRAVMYRLEPSGDLYFGGGRDARIRAATESAGRLSDAQRLELWRIILEHGLLDADGQLMPKAQKVAYEVTLQAGRQRNHFNTVDDRTPGLDLLEKKLFQLQAAKRHGQVIDAVEEKIRKGGEDIKRR